MTQPSSEQVYLRSDLMFFGRDRIHLASNTEYPVTPPDAALLELVYRGYSEFSTLRSAMRALVSAPQADAIAARLADVMRDPRSILELRAAPALDRPDVIVCDLTSMEAGIRGSEVARQLRRSFRVALLGLDDRVRGDPRWNASFAMTKKAGHHENWFEFLQWCRGFVGSNPQALLVLCGQQDAILFGDMTRRIRSVVVTSSSWPSPTTPVDLYGSSRLPDGEFEAMRSLFYSMQFTNGKDWGSVQRATCSDLALLEACALRHAVSTLYCEVDQLEPLHRLGRSADTTHFCHRVLPTPREQRVPEAGDTVLVVGGLEAEGRPLARFLGLLLALPPGERRFRHVFVPTTSTWLRADVHADGRIGLHPAAAPPLAACIGAFALTGLLRDPGLAFDVMARGIPTVFVPSERMHPLMSQLSDDMIFPETSSATLPPLIARWLDPNDPWTARTATAQAALVDRLGIVNRILDVAHGDAATSPRGGADA